MYATSYSNGARANAAAQVLDAPLKLVRQWGPNVGQPRVAGGCLLLPGFLGATMAYDVETLEPRWIIRPVSSARRAEAREWAGDLDKERQVGFEDFESVWKEDPPCFLNSTTDGTNWYCGDAFGKDSCDLYALECRTGELVWKHERQRYTIGMLDAVVAGRLLVGGFGKSSSEGSLQLTAFDLDRREIRWMRSESRGHFAIAGDVVVTPRDDKPTDLIAIRLQDGEIAWQAAGPTTCIYPHWKGNPFAFKTFPVIHEGIVIAEILYCH